MVARSSAAASPWSFECPETLLKRPNIIASMVKSALEPAQRLQVRCILTTQLKLCRLQLCGRIQGYIQHSLFAGCQLNRTHVRKYAFASALYMADTETGGPSHQSDTFLARTAHCVFMLGWWFSPEFTGKETAGDVMHAPALSPRTAGLLSF